MAEKHYIQQKLNTDLNVYRCGVEACEPGHVWGPGVRDHFLIHVIRQGKGTLVLNGQTHELGAGDGFLVPPDVPVFWKADGQSPWHYAWVGFHGLRAAAVLERAGLDADHPIFRPGDDNRLTQALSALVEAARTEEAGSMATPGELLLTGHLYLFLAQLCQVAKTRTPEKNSAADKARHVRRAMAYLARHYPEPFRVSDMARALGLDRSYLSTLVRRQTGQPPQTHLIRFRMERAAQLMDNDQLTVADIARSVGYEDPAQFSKAFRTTHGCSPTAYRKLGSDPDDTPQAKTGSDPTLTGGV